MRWPCILSVSEITARVSLKSLLIVRLLLRGVTASFLKGACCLCAELLRIRLRSRLVTEGLLLFSHHENKHLWHEYYIDASQSDRINSAFCLTLWETVNQDLSSVWLLLIFMHVETAVRVCTQQPLIKAGSDTDCFITGSALLIAGWRPPEGTMEPNMYRKKTSQAANLLSAVCLKTSVDFLVCAHILLTMSQQTR